MKQRVLINILIGLVACISLSRCSKEFLETKPDNALIIPSTLTDMQALLDNDRFMNGYVGMGGPNPGLGEMGADNYFMNESNFDNLLPFSKNVYKWSATVYEGATVFDWNFSYRAILYTNTVLEGLSKIPVTSENQNEWNNVKGSALFFRAHTFYQLAQVFAPSYNPQTIATDIGIPLRQTPDISVKATRASLKETYDLILNDLKESKELLPVNVNYKTRPSKPAALGLLARVYQTMQGYDSALVYANACLDYNSQLLDYNTLDSTAFWPIPRANKEVIFETVLQVGNKFELMAPWLCSTDSSLVSSYDNNDLRKPMFFFDLFGAKNGFRGSYMATVVLFCGLATDEIYLIRAECNARKGNVSTAMDDLNTLLATRWISNSFIPYGALDSNDALIQILNERRKELIYRGLRWTDLRRLNLEPAFAKTLKRVVKGEIFELPPNSNRYVWPIPDDVISFNPDMPQNPR